MCRSDVLFTVSLVVTIALIDQAYQRFGVHIAFAALIPSAILNMVSVSIIESIYLSLLTRYRDSKR